FRAGAALVVRADGLTELVTDEKELALLVALGRVRVELAEGGETHAHDGDDDEQADVGETALLQKRGRNIGSPGLVGWRPAAIFIDKAHAAPATARLPVTGEEAGIGDAVAL